MTDFLIGKLGIYAGILVVGIVSGLVPFIPAEVALAAVVVVAGNFPLAVALGVLVALGQMIAKAALYKGAQRAAAIAGEPAPDSKLAKAKRMVDRWKDKPLALTFVAATIGIPPLYVISLLAGVLGIRFRAFMAIGMLGRTIRFVTVALIALYASH